MTPHDIREAWFASNKCSEKVVDWEDLSEEEKMAWTIKCASPAPDSDQLNSCYCMNCEELSKELAFLKERIKQTRTANEPSSPPPENWINHAGLGSISGGNQDADHQDQSEAFSRLLTAANAVLEWIEVAHRPPVRDGLEVGRMVRVRLHALADLHAVVQQCNETSGRENPEA